MAASPHSRKDLLTLVLKLIQDNSLLSEEDLFRLARQAAKSHARSIYTRSISARSILVIGESSIIFNPFSNHNLFATLEKECRVVSQPMAEVCYLFWHDWVKRGKNFLARKNLATHRKLMIRINKILGSISPFEQDPHTLITEADKRLSLFNGSNGRYRMAKLCSTSIGVDGIITVGSAYENTGIIIRQLGDYFSEDQKLPVLNLLFDGSDHNRNNDLIHNFLYYLPFKPSI